MSDSPDHLQERTLAAYLQMTLDRVCWGGALVMVAAGPSAEPVTLAAVAAHAAVLWVDTQEASLRRAAQRGVVDFQVSGLPEAVRILKNEVRRSRPVSVGLLNPSGGSAAERTITDVNQAMAARSVWAKSVRSGLQPDALFWGADGQSAPADERSVHVLRQRGALLLGRALPNRSVRCLTATNWRERRESDAALLERAGALPGAAGIRARQWHAAAPALFPRDLFRCDIQEWSASNGAG